MTMLDDERVASMLAELAEAGDDWSAVPQRWQGRWDLRTRIRKGRTQGRAWVRPAVFVAAEHPRFPQTPVTLLLHEDGTWWHKGTRQGRL